MPKSLCAVSDPVLSFERSRVPIAPNILEIPGLVESPSRQGLQGDYGHAALVRDGEGLHTRGGRDRPGGGTNARTASHLQNAWRRGKPAEDAVRCMTSRRYF